MLDSFTVATKGGRVLWTVDYLGADAATAARDPGGDGRGGGGPAADPVDALFRTVLVEERAGLDSYTTGPSALRWSFVVYQKILQLPYVDELLSSAKALFCKTFAEELKDSTRLHSFAAFDEVFVRLLQQLESKQSRKAERFPRAFKDTKKGRALQLNAANGSPAATEEENEPASGHVADVGGEVSRSARWPPAGARRRGPKSIQGKRKAAGKAAAAAEDAGAPASKKGGKRRTVWTADGQMMELDDAEVVLDYSAGERAAGDGAAAVDELVEKGSMGKITGREGFYEVADLGDVISEEDDDEDEIVAPPRADAG
ncbi:MAG: signal recognition particle receptor, alpha subunit, partial [Olpidium bornovanus]